MFTQSKLQLPISIIFFSVDFSSNRYSYTHFEEHIGYDYDLIKRKIGSY